MAKYLLKRILYSIFSIICIMIIMIILLFTAKDRNTVISSDPYVTRLQGNTKELYKLQLLEKYDYIEMHQFAEYINAKYSDTLTPNELQEALTIPYVTKAEADADETLKAGKIKKDENPYVVEFANYYESKGYSITYLDASFNRKGVLKDDYNPMVIATYDSPIFTRLWHFFSGIFQVETTNDVYNLAKEGGNYFSTGYYMVSDITDWDNFTSYWGSLDFRMTESSIYSDYANNVVSYVVNASITEEQITQSGGSFEWNVYYIDETTGEKTKMFDTNLVVTEPGTYRFAIDKKVTSTTVDGQTKLSYSYTSEQVKTSDSVFATTTFVRGDVYPVENPGISLIWDEYSNMPALVGSGTKHKYLIYFDDQFPFIHQNIFKINIGVSMTGETKGTSVLDLMFSNNGQGEIIAKPQEYPTQIGTGNYIDTSDNFHSVTYTVVNQSKLNESNYSLYGERYYVADSYFGNMARVGYSFTIGIISTFLAYLLGLPLGILMARKKDKIADNIGMAYIIFMIAVPSLAYIYIFNSLGQKMGLPVSFSYKTEPAFLVYILPIVSLTLPSVAGIMKWIRRYMIDQSNSDYVKFARSQGLSEGEIFRKHIMKNAIIPIVHGIPGSIIGCLAGAFITEQVYAVPGTGGLLMSAINNNDNALILGLTFFYSILSIIALILGDILLTVVDPRISFTGGRK